MPKYDMLLKDILIKKHKLEEHETIMLTKESSALPKQKLPPKLKDPGSFTIYCLIGDIHFNDTLYDLGASVNIMPYSLFKKLVVSEVKSTTILLQLANRSIVYPRGIIEDVLIKVEHFIFLVNFVVLHMEKDRSIQLILRRSFIRTAHSLIHIHADKLILRLRDDQIEFSFRNTIRYPFG